MRPILISDSFKQQDFVFYAPDIYQFELPDDPKTNVESPRKTQSLRAADFDRRLQPNSILRDKLETIIKVNLLLLKLRVNQFIDFRCLPHSQCQPKIEI
jgi:hypothetical protein